MNEDGLKIFSNISSELRLRVVSALVLAPVVLSIVWIGGWLFAALLMIAGFFMAREIVALVDPVPDYRNVVPVVAAAVLAVMVTAGGMPGGGVAVVAAGMLFGAGQRLWSGQPIWPALIAFLYVVLPLVALVWLRLDEEYGRIATYWLVGLVWATDIGAYFAGRAIGGPKLSPRFSPNKTWAGLIGGVLGASLVGGIISLLNDAGSPLALALVSAVLAIVAQAGDIAESALKRRAGVKDSGTLIPGHGGILDRLDGLVAAAVVAALIALLHGSASPSVGVLIWL